MAGRTAPFTKPTGPTALRLAAANLLRLAMADLDDARLLLRQGRTRNGAGMVNAALARVVRAVVASEHGWGRDRGERGIGAVPVANAIRAELAAASALAVAPPETPVRSDGSLVPEPGADQVSRALKLVASTVKTIAKAFDVVISGTGPAGHVAPIRPEPPPEPEEPEPPTRTRVVGHARERRVPAAPAPIPGPPPRERDREPAWMRLPTVVNRSSPTKVRPAPRMVSPRIDGKRATTPAASPPEAAVEEPLQLPAPAPPGRPARTVARIVGRPKRLPNRNSEPSLPIPAPPDQVRAVAGEPPRRSRRAAEMSSTAFWSLADRWKMPDLTALELIGHPGGLTKKGTRPRFRVTGDEAKLFGLLQEIDAALEPFGTAPAVWLRQPIAAAPFKSATPLEQISRRGQEGAHDIIRRIMQLGLQSPT
jgi:hypothetical protein